MSDRLDVVTGRPDAAAGPPRRASDPAALEIVGATRRYGTRLALDGVDLAVDPGCFCVLLGPSGSGKTTLLRTVAGIERLTSGRIHIDGRLVADGGAHRHPEERELAMVFQDYALWPHLSASRNVAFALGRRRLGRAEAARRAREMLDRVGLGQLADHYPNELSGGEQQRVALARALVAGTGVVLFDEPLSNLDADLRERMRLEIATLTRESGATSLYITHDQAEAFALADRIGVLHDGRLEQVGTPEAVYHRPATPFVARFTGLAGELPVTVEGASGTGPLRWARPLGVGAAELPPIGVHPPDPAMASGPARLLIRPAAVHLAPPGHPGRHLDAMVMDTAYRGRGYDHALMLADGSRLVGVHDERRWARGDHVAVELRPAGCLVFAAGPDQPAPT